MHINIISLNKPYPSTNYIGSSASNANRPKYLWTICMYIVRLCSIVVHILIFCIALIGIRFKILQTSRWFCQVRKNILYCGGVIVLSERRGFFAVFFFCCVHMCVRRTAKYNNKAI